MGCAVSLRLLKIEHFSNIWAFSNSNRWTFSLIKTGLITFLFKINDKIAYPVKFDIASILLKSRQSIVEKVTNPES